MIAKKTPNNVDTYVGSRLKARRLAVGMSQTDLAEHVDLTFQQVQKYEKGTNRMGASRLMQFADLLGVPVQYFFEDAPTPDGMRATRKTATTRPADKMNSFLATQNGAGIIMACMELNDAQYLRIVRKFIEGLVEAVKVRRT